MFKYAFLRRPRFDKSNTQRLAFLRPFSPPKVSVNGNGGVGVLRSFAPLSPAVIIPNPNATTVSVLGNGNTLGGTLGLSPLSETTPQGAVLQSMTGAM